MHARVPGVALGAEFTTLKLRLVKIAARVASAVRKHHAPARQRAT